MIPLVLGFPALALLISVHMCVQSLHSVLEIYLANIINYD